MVNSDNELDVYEDEEGAPSIERPEKEAARVALHSGEALVEAELNKFLLQKDARLIALVGERNSGKSTLISSLYERFLRGAFAGFEFAGSYSIVALERRGHLSRVESGAAIPDTPRTSLQEGLQYFHLSMVDTEHNSSVVDLMISDRAGEAFRLARANTKFASELTDLSSVDRVVLLLDGAGVADPVERANALQAVRQTLRALLDSNVLRANAKVQIVLTKADVIDSAPNPTSLNASVELFFNGLITAFGAKLQELSFWRTAARSVANTLEPAYGLDILLRNWCMPPTSIVVEVNSLPDGISSEFDRLFMRTKLGAEE